MKKYNGSILLVIFFLMSFVATSTVTEPVQASVTASYCQGSLNKIDINKTSVVSTKHLTGAKSLTNEEKQWMQNNMINTKYVELNKIGMQRTNEVRTEKGIEAVNSNKAVELGNEVISENPTKKITLENSSTSTAADTFNLPFAIDNSELQYFPPIGNQGDLSSCTAFATTYYQATYMNALAKGLDVKNNPDNSKILSPKWTYDFINYGQDIGSSSMDAYKLFMEQGIAAQSDFLYLPDNTDAKNYLQWPADSTIWENASKVRADKLGYIQVYDGSDTPVKDVDSANLKNVKKLLTDGYILNCMVPIDGIQFKIIKDNVNSTNDDKQVGKGAGYVGCGGANHSMTIVGYNDDIWVDINENGVIDRGEKGAFKIANSWGKEYGSNLDGKHPNDGFIWICYDALNKVSSVEGNTVQDTSRINVFDDNNYLYWMTVKASNTPKLLVQVDINTGYRDQLNYVLGYSETNEANPKITWEPYILNKGSGDYSFTGSSIASDGIIVLDYSNFLNQSLSSSTKRWYIKITDTTTDDPNKTGSFATIKGFKFIDPSASKPYVSQTSYDYKIGGVKVNLNENFKLNSTNYKKIDGNSVTLSVDYKLNSTNIQNSQWHSKNNYSSAFNYPSKILSYNNKLYAVCKDKSDSKDKIFQYDPSLDVWSIYDNKFSPNRGDDIFILNSKMYIIGYSGAVQIYDISTKTWGVDSTFSMPKGIINYTLTAFNNKLYVVGGEINSNNKFTATNSVWQFDPLKKNDTLTKGWTRMANMEYPAMNALVSVAKDPSDGKEKIYVMGGLNENFKAMQHTQKYDEVNNIWSPEGLNSYPGLSYAVTLNGKIYMFSNSWNTVYEYNVGTKVWSQKDSIPSDDSNYTNFVPALGKIYAIGSNNNYNTMLEFDPSVNDNVDRTGLPYFNILDNGTTDGKQISIKCSTPNAIIRYTTDGSIPNAKSKQYTDPINIYKSCTVKAIAEVSGLLDSYVATAPHVAVPALSLMSGTYKYYQKLSISCDNTTGSVIRYTTDGTEPSQSSAIYTKPIILHDKMTVKAVGMQDGYITSDLATASYTAPSLIGDVNRDGKLNVEDYLIMKNYINGKIKHFNGIDDDLWVGDVNGDGVINNTDYILLRYRIVGNIKYFPKEQPASPTNLIVQLAATNSITLSWQASTGLANIASYQIYRNGSLLAASSTNKFTDSTVTQHTKYTYTVIAVDSDGRKSVYSNGVEASTDSSHDSSISICNIDASSSYATQMLNTLIK